MAQSEHWYIFDKGKLYRHTELDGNAVLRHGLMPQDEEIQDLEKVSSYEKDEAFNQILNSINDCKYFIYADRIYFNNKNIFNSNIQFDSFVINKTEWYSIKIK
jgi:hypothetical protein